MQAKHDHFSYLKLVCNKLLKQVEELSDILAHFNEDEQSVLSIRTMADINKISAAISSLKLETSTFMRSKIRVLKQNPKIVTEELLLFRHKARMMMSIIRGYSEMVIEDLESDQLANLINKLLPVIGITKKIILLINELKESEQDPDSSLQLEELKEKKLTQDDDKIKNDLIARSTILIVDDSDANCDLMSTWLQRKNYKTIIAKSGKQALSILEKNNNIDVVLLDVMMPFMDGFDVLMQIKSNETLSDVMIIMISGVDEIDLVVKCIMNGAEDYLLKPFNPYLLSARIYACLDKKRLHRIEKDYLDYLTLLYFSELVNGKIEPL